MMYHNLNFVHTCAQVCTLSTPFASIHPPVHAITAADVTAAAGTATTAAEEAGIHACAAVHMYSKSPN